MKRAARWALRLITFLFALALLVLVLAFGDRDDLFGPDTHTTGDAS